MNQLQKLLYFKNQDFYIFNIILPLSFLIFTLLLMPINQVFQFDPDEGIALAQANLYSQGIIQNYSQSWSDQPPLFPILISQYINLFGNNISNARILTLLFSTLLVWSFSQILRLSVGRIAAIITIVLFFISINFVRLSVSVMQGIPCLSLGMLSIYFTILYTLNLRFYWLILSGIILALSLQIKMIMIFLLPVVVIYLFINNDQISFTSIPQIQLKLVKIFHILKSPIFIFLLSLSTAFVTVGLITQSLNLENILLFHLSSNLKDNFADHNSLQDVIYIYLQNFDALLLGFLPLQYRNIKYKYLSDFDKNLQKHIYKIPLVWLVIITVVFVKHKPIWYHYIILISLPLFWLSSYGIRTILDYINCVKIKQLKQSQIPKFIIFTILFTLLVIPVKIGVIQWENHNFIEKSQVKFANLERVLTYKNDGKWLFTDVGMYGFYSQMNIPPEITVISRKRLGSGTLDSNFLIKVLEKYQPEQILINRFLHLADLMKPYIDKNYQEVYTDKSTKHYLRNDVHNN